MRMRADRPPRPIEDYTVNADTGCWEWNGSKNHQGYGRMGGNEAGIPHRAHRIYYERAKGPIPHGLDLDHLCRNRGCVNPDHLEAVSRATNLRRGYRTKLTEEKVREIRERLSRGGITQSCLAKEYGVGETMIGAIKHNRKWKDV
jgi:hypothetical protein